MSEGEGRPESQLDQLVASYPTGIRGQIRLNWDTTFRPERFREAERADVLAARERTLDRYGVHDEEMRRRLLDLAEPWSQETYQDVKACLGLETTLGSGTAARAEAEEQEVVFRMTEPSRERAEAASPAPDVMQRGE